MEHSKTCNFVSCYVVLSRPYKVQHFVARHVKTIGQQDPSAGNWYATYAYKHKLCTQPVQQSASHDRCTS